jgi:hypothetical protein
MKYAEPFSVIEAVIAEKMSEIYNNFAEFSKNIKIFELCPSKLKVVKEIRCAVKETQSN